MRKSLMLSLALPLMLAAQAMEPPQIGGEWAPSPKPTPKRGKPSKAEKKAAKRARRNAGVAPCDGGKA